MSGPRFFIGPGDAVFDKKLKGTAFKVLCLLGMHIDNNGWCQRSQVKMAKQLGVGRSTIYDAINLLVDLEYVQTRIQKQPHQKGERDGIYQYRVILDRPDVVNTLQDATTSSGVENWENEDNPAGIPAPPAAPEPAPPAGPEPAPKNVPLRTTQSEQSPPLPPVTGGEQAIQDLFEGFWSVVSEEYQNHLPRSRAFARFQRSVSGHLEEAQTIAEAWKLYTDRQWSRAFNTEDGRKKKTLEPSLNRFLRKHAWLDYVNDPPPVSETGYFIITPGRPEWSSWLGYMRNRHGESGVQSIVMLKQFKAKTRWPDGPRTTEKDKAA